MIRPLSDRVLAQVRLALLSDCGCSKTIARTEREGRRTGLTGAEIDAALALRSFEARTAAAISYACALRTGNPGLLASETKNALQSGLTEEMLAQLAVIVEETALASRTQQSG